MTTNENTKTAACVVAIHPFTGEVLSATRRGTLDDWGIIGGKIDQDERALDAAMREFEEETGVALSMWPEYIGRFEDEEGWQIYVYVITNQPDLLRIAQEFNQSPKEIEPGIQVGYVPYAKLIEKTFAKFNIALLGPLLKFLL